MRLRVVFTLFLIVWYCKGQAQRPQLVVQTGHTAPINALAISPNGKFILTSDWNRQTKLWDIESSKELKSFPNLDLPRGYNKLSIHPNNQVFVVGTPYGSLKICELASGRIVKELALNGSEITDVKFSPKGNFLMASWGDGRVAIWKTDDYKLYITLKSPHNVISTIQFSPNEKWLLSGGLGGTLLLWDVKTQRPKKTLLRKGAAIYSTAFSPNGKYIVSGGEDGLVKLFKTVNGQYINAFEEHQDGILNVDFNQDNKTIVSGDRSGRILLWDATIGDTLRTIAQNTPFLNTVRFHPDGKHLICNQRENIQIWKIEGSLHSTFKSVMNRPHANFVNAIQFSPDGRNIVSSGGRDKAIHFWGEISGKTLKIDTTITTTQYAPNGKLLACSDVLGNIFLWTERHYKQPKILKGHTSTINAIQFTPQSDKLVSAGDDNLLIIWEIATRKKLHILEGHESMIFSIHVDRTGQYLVSGDATGVIKLWDITTGQLVKNYYGSKGMVMTVKISPDGTHILGGTDNGILTIWDVKTGRIESETKAHEEMMMTMAFSPNGQYLMTGGQDKKAHLWEASTMKRIDQFEEHTNGISCIDFQPQGRFIITGSYDNSIKLWDTQKSKAIATIYVLGEKDWAIVSDEGLFDASEGAMTMMHYIADLEPFELNQLKERYFEPDLLQKLLGYNPEPLRDITMFEEVDLFPKLRLKIRGNREPILHIDLTPRKGGIGKVAFFINKKEIVADINPKRKKQLKIKLKKYTSYFSPTQLNIIGVRTYNQSGWLRSRMKKIGYKSPTFVARGDEKGKKKGKTRINLGGRTPKLYAIVIGTSNYRGENLDLTYADKDAKDMAAAIQATAQALFGKDRVAIHLLTTDNPTDSSTNKTTPSKKNILHAFQTVAQKATPEDLIVVYLAGHGVTHQTQTAQFYYLTKDMASGDLSDGQLRTSYAISTNELTQLLKTITAKKQIMIIDACASGSLVEDVLTQARSISSSQRRALDRLKDRTGTFILAGSAANRVSYEASQFGQGLLTYSLLLGMSGSALRQNQYVDILHLFQFAVDKVPEFAAFIGGVQRPVIAAPSGSSSFDIGQLTDSVQIPITDVKPIFIRSNFQETKDFGDSLELSKKLDDKFMDISASGKSASIIFVDVPKYPNAYSIKGRYQLEGNSITLDGRIFKGFSVLERFKIQGKASDLDEVLQQVLMIIEEKIQP